jgi:hypothetical protein
MNAPYLILGLLCGLAIGYVIGWQHERALAKRALAGTGPIDCSEGSPCSTCPGKDRCRTGCYRQEEAIPAPLSELTEIHRVIMNVGGDWPDDERDPYTLRHVKWMARQLNAGARAK